MQAGPIAEKFNQIKKFVATQTLTEGNWQGTVLLTGDTLEQVKILKASDGPDLHMWGSADFIQTLLQHNLIDRMNLWTYLVILGKGKKLFADGTMPVGMQMTKQAVSSTGVVCATYEPIGNVPIGDATKD